MNRFLSWFSTERGKRFTHCCVGVTAVTIFSSQIAIQGPFMYKVKEIFQLYQYEKPKPFSPKLNEIVQQALDDCSLKENEKKKIEFYYVVGHEPCHLGGIGSPWGAIIGLPFYFGSPKEFKLKYLRIRGKEAIDWIIEGQDLLDSFVMSDSAKKFAIMREIYSCNYSDVITNAFIGVACVILPAKFAQRINHVSLAFERLTFRQRCFRYLVFYSLGYIMYRLMKDPLKHFSQAEADKLAAETSIEYLSGGIEFYERMLMKNIALEEMANSRFRTYDEKGDEDYFLLVPKLPTTKRLENLQKMKKEKTHKKEE